MSSTSSQKETSGDPRKEDGVVLVVAEPAAVVAEAKVDVPHSD